MLRQKSKDHLGVSDPSPTIAPQIIEQIRIMPERFYVAPRQRTHPTFVILGGLTVVVGLLVVVALVVWKSGGLEPRAVAPVVSPTPGPTAVNVGPTPEVSPAPAATPLSEPTPVASVGPEALATTTEPVVPSAPEALSGARDADQDGLSLDEENLYQTSPTNADSDGDGYPDGAEVRRGFSPNAGGGVTLIASEAFATVPTTAGFTWAYPPAWMMDSFSEGGVRTIRLDTRVGEYMAATLYPNPEKIPLATWLKQQGETALEAATVGGQAAFRRSGGSGPYFLLTADRQSVIALSDEAQGGSQSFSATFAAIVASFQIKP